MHPILLDLKEQLTTVYPVSSRALKLYPLYDRQYQLLYKPFWKAFNYEYVLEFDRNRLRQSVAHAKMVQDLLDIDDIQVKQKVRTVLKPFPPSLNPDDHINDKKLYQLCLAFKPWYDARAYIGIIEVLLQRGEAVSTVIDHAKQLFADGWGDDL